MCEMLTPSLGSRGLGVGIVQRGETLIFQHRGGNEGYRSYWHGFLSPKISGGLVVLTNGGRGHLLANEIFEEFSKRRHWPHAGEAP